MNPFKTFFGNKLNFLVGFIFMTHSLLISQWIIYIPHVKDKLTLSEGDLGLALFCLALGAFTIMPISSKIINALGDGRTTFYSLIFYALVVPLPFLTEHFVWLCVTLYLIGAGAGLMDIAMNALASTVEKEKKVFIMSGCHGFFSLGAMIGAGSGSVIAVYQVSPFWHTVVVGAVLLIIHFIVVGIYAGIKSKQDTQSTQLKFSIKAILGLVIIGFCIMIGEGAVADWSTVYLKEHVKADVLFWGFGFAGFSFAMAVGRFAGDIIGAKYGALNIIRVGGIIGVIGLGGVLTGDLVLTIVGFSLVGFGFSGIVPVLYRISSNLKTVPASQGIAAIAGSGYVGFLLGPVILGFVAEVSSLKGSFALLLVLTLITVVISRKSIEH
ncbi:MAG: MFS transporter [Bacteroidota bacterium]